MLNRWNFLKTGFYEGIVFNLLIGISERQQVLLEQIQRDGQKTQRLWVNLCKKYGWLEDEDLLGG